jgi:hypothetical protein
VAARRLFALDQNFPLPIVDALALYIHDAELVAVKDIDPRLSEVDDWQLLLALHHHERPWDGLITTDSGMVDLPRELAVLLQTKLSLVVVHAAGHDPIRATGLVLAHLPWICERTKPNVPQLWVIRASEKRPEDPWKQFQRMAKHQNRRANDLYSEQRLSDVELATNPLSR